MRLRYIVGIKMDVRRTLNYEDLPQVVVENPITIVHYAHLACGHYKPITRGTVGRIINHARLYDRQIALECRECSSDTDAHLGAREHA